MRAKRHRFLGLSGNGTLHRIVEIIADDIRTHGALTHAPCLSYSAVREVFIKYVPEFLICGRRAFLDDAKLTSYVAKGT